MTDEAIAAEVAGIFTHAGWAPHFGLGGYAKRTAGGWLVGGAPDPEKPLVTHMKITDKDPDTPETPDDPVEAARLLVAREAAREETVNVSCENEPEYAAPHETHGETGVAQASEQASGDASLSGDEAGHSAVAEGLYEDDGGGALAVPAVIEADQHHEDGRTTEVFDADFGDPEPEELGGELLDDFVRDPLLLAEPEGEAPATDEPEPLTGLDRFIGLDDLDRVRKLRIGDVAAAAALRIAAIEQEVNEREGEYAIVQGFVVTNLDKHTGAFTLQDDASKATAHRYYELDAARARVANIDRVRKEATAFLLEATREEVEAFDPEAGWP